MIGVLLAGIGMHLALEREDRLMLNASPSFERTCSNRKYSKCKSTVLQQMVNTAGYLVALISSVLCLLDSALWQTGWIDRAFSFGLLALPLAVIADTIIIFRARKRLRKWIQLTKGKKHLNIKEKREAMRRMEE